MGDEEGHVIAIYESKGINTNLQGKKFLDGWLYRETGLIDINGKAGTWSAQGYAECTDGDGDKIYVPGKGRRRSKDTRRGHDSLVKGTGKWQGIQGKGTWLAIPAVDNRWYSDGGMGRGVSQIACGRKWRGGNRHPSPPLTTHHRTVKGERPCPDSNSSHSSP